MNKLDYKNRQDDLFERWKRERPDYESNGRRFVNDGITDVSKWNDAKPKTLFLLKENPDGEWEPAEGITTNSGPFSRNIVRWHSVLQALFQEPSAVLSFTNIRLPETVKNIALVEVKKVNEGRRTSSPKEILKYAANDSKFLKEQIELIQPEVIFCCYTSNAYEEIYPNEPWEEKICCVPAKWNPKGHCSCDKHRGRLVIDFYHPSQRIRDRDKDLFEMLCEMIQKHRVFDRFSWNKAK
jgi:hypothetical protein